MKVYLTNDTRAEVRLELGEFSSLGVDQGIRSAARMFGHDGHEIARMTDKGWQQVVSNELVGPYYKHCDIEESSWK